MMHRFAELTTATTMLLLLLGMCLMLTVSEGNQQNLNGESGTSHRKRKRPTNEKDLNIGGIFPMTGSWAGGQGCYPAIQMALSDVNTRPDILPGYRLKLVGNDSMCMPGLGMKVLYELLYNKPPKIMLLGPGCSVVSTFVGQAARMWNLIVLSYGSSSPALSNSKRFPTFFRTHPSATLHNPTRVKLFQKFEWTRIATIQETQEIFTSTIEDLEERVKKAGIEIAVRTSFLTDPTNAVRNLKRQDARIIVGLFYEDMARRVFCEVYKQKLYGPKHVWFIIGWYADNWYAVPDPHVNCTAAQMREALEGHFTTEGLMLNQDNVPTISGMTSQAFMRKLEQKLKKKDEKVNPLSVVGYVEAPLAYDAVWALALALNKTQNRLKKKRMSLEQFTYDNREIMEEIYGAMNTTNFLGVSGRVRFNAEGDRIAWTQIEQMSHGNYVTLGYYDIASDNLTWNRDEKWPGGKKPQDRTIVVPILREVSQGLFIAMCLLASVGIMACILLLGFNCKHQHRRYIQMSQPHINNMMLAGCIVCLACIYLEGLDGRYVSENGYPALCQARAWVLSLGFTLAYGSMFSKVWTIYRLTTRRKKEIKVLREWEMYIVLCLFLVVDIIVLTVWQIIDPLYRELESFPHELPKDTDKDIQLKPQLEHCSSRYLNVWLGVVFGYKGVLLLFGLLLAYETRSVKIKQVNDSRFVGMSIYNVVVLCIITAPVTLIIGSHQDASFAFVAVAIILSSFLAVGLIFVPKILEVVRNPRDGMESTSLTDSTASREEEERHRRLMCENENLKKQIAEKEEKIKDLNRRVQLKAQQRAKQQQQFNYGDTNAIVTSANNTDQSQLGITGDVIIVNNSIPTKRIDVNQSEEPNVGTLVTIATNSTENSSVTKAKPVATSIATTKTLQSGVVDTGGNVMVARNDVVTMDTSPPSLAITVDGNSDSALPPTSSTTTTKSSKTSGSGEENNYSESYC